MFEKIPQLQIPSASRSFILSISTLFSGWTPNLCCFGSLRTLIAMISATAESYFQSKCSKLPLHTPCSASNGRQTRWTTRCWTLYYMEHLTARCFRHELVEAKTELKLTKHWTSIHKVGTRTAGCVVLLNCLLAGFNNLQGCVQNLLLLPSDAQKYVTASLIINICFIKVCSQWLFE